MAWQDDLIEAAWYSTGGGSMPPPGYTGAASSETHTGTFALTASSSSYEGAFPLNPSDYVGATRPIPGGYSGAVGDPVAYTFTAITGAGDITFSTDIPGGSFVVRFLEVMTSPGGLPSQGPLSDYVGTDADPAFIGASGGFQSVGSAVTPTISVDSSTGVVTITGGGSDFAFAAYALDGSVNNAGYYFIGHGGQPAPDPATASYSDLVTLTHFDGSLGLTDRLAVALWVLTESAPSGPTTVQWRLTEVWVEPTPTPPPPPTAAHMTIAASPTSLPADGTSTSIVTARIAKADGTGLSGETPVFLPLAQFGAITDVGDGTYTATYTATTVPGTVPITASDGPLSASTAIIQGRASGAIHAGRPNSAVVR